MSRARGRKDGYEPEILNLSTPAYERDIDLGRDGSKWRHGWIPLNAAATAIKLKKTHASGSDRPGGKSRLSTSTVRPSRLKLKGERGRGTGETPLQKALRTPMSERTPEQHKLAIATIGRSATPKTVSDRDKATLHAASADQLVKYRENYGPGTPEHDAINAEIRSRINGRSASAPSSDSHAAQVKRAFPDRTTPDGFTIKHHAEVGDNHKETGAFSVSVMDAGAKHTAGKRYTKISDGTNAEIDALGRARDSRRGGKELDSRYVSQPRSVTSDLLSHDESEQLRNRKAQIGRMNSIDKRAIANSNLSHHPAEKDVAARTRELGQINRKLKKHHAAGGS